MVESGPASGVWGAAELGRLIGEPNVLALDIGGTTAKCSLIENGQVKIKTDYWIERDRRSAGYPIMVPVVDLVEIGNGGGSIAWVDDFGKLHVGPRSAGALPGPGRLRPRRHESDHHRRQPRARPHQQGLFLRRRDRRRHGAPSTLRSRRLAERLGVDAGEAARGIVRIANNNMINALKLVSLNRGHDPRDFTLVAFGGGGGMHAVALAAELGISKVVIPRGASVFSAWGMMMSDLRRDYFVDAADRDRPRRRAAAAALDGLVRRDDRAGEVAVRRRRASTRSRLSFVRYRQVPLPEPGARGRGRCSPAGPVDEAALARLVERFPRDLRARIHLPARAPVEIVGIHLSPRPRSASSNSCRAAGDRRHARSRAQGHAATVDYRDWRASTRPRSTTARGSSRA